MSAADRTVVRTRDGQYRVMSRREAAGMISMGRAKLAPAPRRSPARTVSVKREPVTVVTHERPSLAFRAERGPVHYPIMDTVQTDPEPVAFIPEMPKVYASKATWADYARHLGATITDDMTKAEIQAAARDIADDPARLPQPAREGGRLETPEDEPVPEAGTDDTGPV